MTTNFRSVSFYNKNTGLFADSRITASSDELVRLNTPVDHIAIDGHHDHMCKKVDLATGQIVDHQPPAPSDDYEWNDGTKRWILKQAIQDKLTARANALQRIAALEAAQPRIMREIIIHLLHKRDGEPEYALNQLIEIDDQITELRKEL
jgi:hypothetical protein